jgi:hypothetical protein
VLVERVLGYDGEGRALEALFLDGVEAQQIAYYELDPDDRMLRRGRTGEWRERQHASAAAASPAVAALIRKWADQTAEYGAVDDLDDEPDVVADEVVAVDLDRRPPAQQPSGQR